MHFESSASKTIHPSIHSLIHPQPLSSTSGLAPGPSAGVCLGSTGLTVLSTGQSQGPGPGLWRPELSLVAQASQMTSNPSVTQSSGLWPGSPEEGN